MLVNPNLHPNLYLQVMPPKQPVFAFLPLRSYGFRFIIQGKFVRLGVSKLLFQNQSFLNGLKALPCISMCLLSPTFLLPTQLMLIKLSMLVEHTLEEIMKLTGYFRRYCNML